MATCKECIHYDICLFHITGNENELCGHFIHTADVAPKTETAKEIFAEIEKNECHDISGKTTMYMLFAEEFAELKKKYIGEDTNVPTESEVTNE